LHNDNKNKNVNFERLQKQAQAEVGIFKDLGFADLLTKGEASHDALVSRLNKMFVNYLITTWVPNTLQKLYEKHGVLNVENAKLGMPAAHTPESVQAVRNAIVQASDLSVNLKIKCCHLLS